MANGNSTPALTRWDVLSGFINKHTTNGTMALRWADGSYWYYNGKYYQRATDDDVAKLLSAYCELLGLDIPASTRDDYLRDLRRKVETKSTQSTGVVFRNGSLDPRTGTLSALSPETFARFVMPYDYDPAAKCPGFEEFLLRAVPNEQSRQLLQEGVGGLFWPANPWSYAVFLIGSGNNGKSTLFHVCSKLVGESLTCYRAMEKLFDTFGLVEVHNKLLNIIDEMDSKELKGKAMRDFKVYTGGNPVSSNRKYLGGLDFKPTAKLFIGSNYAPEAKDSSEGFWRRLALIRLPTVIPTDYTLWDRLDAEIQGIANWALAGLKRLLGSTTQGFSLSAEDTALKDSIRLRNNPLPYFVLRHMSYGGPEEFLPYDMIRLHYATFTNERDLPDDWSSQKCRGLVEMYWPKARPRLKGNSRGFSGLTMSNGYGAKQ